MDKDQDLLRNPAVKSCAKIFTLPGHEGGKRLYTWQKSCGTLLASSVHGIPKVTIVNRQGSVQHQIPVNGNCTAMAWDEEGDVLAIVTDKSSVIYFWDCHTQKLSELESNIKDTCSCIAWSKIGKIFTYCTTKGNLLIYNHQRMSKVPILGKHNKGIIACAWSASQHLVLGTANNLLSINNSDGDAIKTLQFPHTPHDIKFGKLKDESGLPVPGNVDNMASLIVGNHTLHLIPLSADADVNLKPVELKFHPTYGNLVTHNWHGDGYIWIGFSKGIVTMVSTHRNEMGRELVLVEFESRTLNWVALCDCTSQFCVCFGETYVELRNTKTPHTVSAIASISQDGNLDQPASCNFSEDGQLLAVLGSEGDLTVFLTSVPLLGSSSDRSCCYMSSLTEFNVYTLCDQSHKLEQVYSLDTEQEPSLIAMGPNHVGVVFNNQARFYNSYDVLIRDSQVDAKRLPVTVKLYNSSITALCINSTHAATLCGHKVYLHPIEAEDEDEASETKLVQEYDFDNGGDRIICICITKDFLGYGTFNGFVKLYHIQTGKIVNTVNVNPETEPKIKSIHPDLTRCKYIITDRDGCGYLFDVRNESLHRIMSFPVRFDVVLWDRDEASSDVFLTHTRGTITVDIFVVGRDILEEQRVHHVETIKVFSTMDSLPLLFLNGIIYSQSSSGKLITTFNVYKERPEIYKSANRFGDYLRWLVGLRKFKDAYILCDSKKIKSEGWLDLAKSAAVNLNLEYAIKCFVRGEDIATAFNISQIDDYDVDLIAGHVALYLGNHDLAEKRYLNSCIGLDHALDMRCNLHQWQEAVNLACNSITEKCSEIYLNYAEEEENNDNWHHALKLFEQAKEYLLAFGGNQDSNMVQRTEYGIARNALRCGSIDRGLKLISELESPEKLALTCAEILENTKFFNEAAELFEKSQKFDRAALLYMKNRQWNRLRLLLPRTTSKKIRLQYAKMKEAEGSYFEAAEIYEEADELMTACKLYLKAGRADEAIRITEETYYPEAAIIIAKELQTNDVTAAIQYLINSEYFEEAVNLSLKEEKYEIFVKLVMKYVENDSPDGIMPIPLINGVTEVANHFIALKDYFNAAKYYSKAGDVEKAYDLLTKIASKGLVVNEEEFMKLLIQVVLDHRIYDSWEHCKAELLEYLLGDKDKDPKDLKYLLEFYSRGKFEGDAVKTALVYCSDALTCGEVDKAQRALLQTVKNLRTSPFRRIEGHLYNALRMIHFLKIAKLHSTLRNSEMAARLFKTVVLDYADFPHQAVAILISTIIECYKCELHATALQACFEALKRHRAELQPEYLEKFMYIVRKYGKDEPEDIEDLLSCCPNCDSQMPNYDLNCKRCNKEIPYCVFSGRHLVRGDFAYCPHCEFPAIKSEIISMIPKMAEAGQEFQCLMCEERLSVSELEDEYTIEDYLNNNWVGTKVEQTSVSRSRKLGLY